MRQERNRYEVFGVIASGGMATIEYGRLHGPHGFTRPVAIKRLHKHLALDPAFVEMFLDEARLSARLEHANIVSTLDVIDELGELGLVMEYVHGESLARLLQLANARKSHVPVRVAGALGVSMLHGLHAAHEACNDDGVNLGIVHRDVSPHNLILGADGVLRILDFGIAKAATKLHITPSGEIKGKLAYIAPEQLSAGAVDRRTDVYGAAVVVWELLTGFPLFGAENEMSLISRVLHGSVSAPSEHAGDVPPELDRIVLKGLSRDPRQRFASAQDMADELERSVGIASQSEVAKWLQGVAGAELAERLASLRALQQSPGRAQTPVESLLQVGAVVTRPIELDSEKPVASAQGSGRPAVDGSRRIEGDGLLRAFADRQDVPAVDGTRRIEGDGVAPTALAQVRSESLAPRSSRAAHKRWIAASALIAAVLVGSMVIARAWWAREDVAQEPPPSAAAQPLTAAPQAVASAPVLDTSPQQPSVRPADVPAQPPQSADGAAQPPRGKTDTARSASASASARVRRSNQTTARASQLVDGSAQAEPAPSTVREAVPGPRRVEPARPAACSPFIYDGLIKRPNTKCVAESLSQ